MEAAQAAMVAATEQRELDRIKVMENQLNARDAKAISFAKEGKPIAMDTPGWEGWFQAFDAESDKWYYFNPETKERQWAGEASGVEGVATAPKEGPGRQGDADGQPQEGGGASTQLQQQQSQQALPIGWHESKTDDGNVYYWNDKGEKQWTRPDASAALAPPPSAVAAATSAAASSTEGGGGGDAQGTLPQGWHESRTDDGNIYYWNDKGEKQWTRPTAAQAIVGPSAQGGAAPLEKVPDVQEFISSSKFAGSKPGYKFQRGARGNGYYLDGEEGRAVAKASSKAAAAAGGASSSTGGTSGSSGGGGKALTVEESGGEAWCYKDMQGDIQGPFSLQQIYSWRKHLPPYLKVWQTQGAAGTRGSGVETTVHALNKIAADGWVSMAQYSKSKAAPDTFTTTYETYNSTGFINGRTGGLQADQGMYRTVDGRVPDVLAVLHEDVHAEYRNSGLDRYMDVTQLHASMEARKAAKRKGPPKLTREEIWDLKERKKDIKKKIRKHMEEQEDARAAAGSKR